MICGCDLRQLWIVQDDGASDASPSTRQHHGVGDLKSRLAALSSRAKESFSKTSKVRSATLQVAMSR